MTMEIKISKINLLLGLALLMVLLQLGCSGLGKPAINGVYLNTAGSEYSKASDTLVVESKDGNHFLIHRKTGFQLLNASGKPGKLQYESEQWTAVWDEQNQLLTEQRSGKRIRFSLDRSTMEVGKRKYKRIN